MTKMKMMTGCADKTRSTLSVAPQKQRQATTPIRSKRGARGAALGVGVLLLLGVVSCAPEPLVPAGGAEKGSVSSESGASWDAPIEDYDPEVKRTELPETLPASFVVPEGVTVDDAGEYSSDRWFVVFAVTTAEDLESLWASIVQENAFAVSDVQDTAENGQSAMFTNEQFHASVLSIPEHSKRWLLSVDLTRN